MKVLAGIPAYNEEKYIGSVVLQAKQHASEVVVVDDGSWDRTVEVARLAGAYVHRHYKNKGYGASVKDLLMIAEDRRVDMLVLLDGDGQHDPNEIPLFIRAMWIGSDLIVGSRTAQDYKTPTYRRIGKGILSKLTRFFSKTNISDPECGFRAFSKKAIKELELREDGMAISSETVIRAADKKLNIAEVPITCIYNEDGSTLHPIKHGWDVVRGILRTGIRRR